MLPRPIVGLVVACLLGAAAVAGPGSAHAHAPSGKAAKKAASYAAAAYVATNDERKERRRTSLRGLGCLQRFAAAQAKAMAEAEKMYHQDLGPVLEECGLRLAGENVAFGFTEPRQVVEAWMASKSHRSNLLRRSYRRMAIAAHQSDDGVWYVAQLFGRSA